ncbi:hypothetical protein SNEBB_008697 [Seison nebaliae]|nr:hypothetical protein SNEBB_008697 [Seison nebaliae]
MADNEQEQNIEENAAATGILNRDAKDKTIRKGITFGPTTTKDLIREQPSYALPEIYRNCNRTSQQEMGNIEACCKLCCFCCSYEGMTSIVNSFAFCPPAATYYIVKGEPKNDDLFPIQIKLNDEEDQQALEKYGEYKCVMELCYHKNEDVIVVVYIRSGEVCENPPVDDKIRTSDYVLLNAHYNGTDIGGTILTMCELSAQLNIDIVMFDYRGFGYSSGSPSEQNFYEDIYVVWQYLTNTLRIPGNKIILFGQSIGTAAVLDLANNLGKNKKINIPGIILESPFVTGLRTVSSFNRFLWMCPFDNISKIKNVECPVLILHGTADKLIPIDHSKTLMEAIPEKYRVAPLYLSGYRHILLSMSLAYFARINEFINQDVVQDP